VNSLVHASMRQYAVISVRTVPHCERVVIAYPDEKTLRDLLAGPSIVALGYSSREEAEASMYRHGTIAQPSRRKSMAPLVANSTQALREVVSSHLLAFSLGKTPSTICGLVQQAFAAVVVVFYSRNLLSAAIRALISFWRSKSRQLRSLKVLGCWKQMSECGILVSHRRDRVEAALCHGVRNG
jgi:hypothetical protein